MNPRSSIAAIVLAAAAFALTACGSAEEPSTLPVQARPVAAASVAPEPTAEPVAPPTEVVHVSVGAEQVAHIAGQSVRVKVLSYDPADSAVAIEVNSGAAPFVVDPAAFILTDADGTEIHGAPLVAAWDRNLAANDQTMGHIAFTGAVAPVTVTYAGLVWAFS